MSEQQGVEPTPSGPEDSSRPADGWAPPPMPTSASRPAADSPGDIAPSSPGSRAIDAYAPRHSLVPALVLLGTLGAAVVVFWSTTGPIAPAPTTTPSASAHPTPRPSPGTPGQLFITDGEQGRGTWRVVRSEWTDTGLNVLVEVYLNSGILTPSFLALPNDTPEFTKSGNAPHSPAFPVGELHAGAVAKGWLYFPLDRDDTTIFLGEDGQPQVSGLDIPG